VLPFPAVQLALPPVAIDAGGAVGVFAELFHELPLVEPQDACAGRRRADTKQNSAQVKTADAFFMPEFLFIIPPLFLLSH
jgi:hypothetical protein